MALKGRETGRVVIDDFGSVVEGKEQREVEIRHITDWGFMQSAQLGDKTTFMNEVLQLHI